MPSSSRMNAVEQQADEPDDDHAGDHQVVAVAGVARIDDQIAEARAQRDHLGRDHHQPGDAEADAHADDDLRQRRREHHLQEQLRARDAEVLRRAQVALLDGVHARGGLHDHREHRGDEDQEDRRGVADAEPEDGDRNPGDRRDRPQDLEQRVQRDEGAVHPAHPQAERNARAPPRAPKPAPTRISDAPMCSHSVPSRASSSVPVTTCPGRREDHALRGHDRRPTRCATTTAITTIDGSACLRPFILLLFSHHFTHAPANLRPRHRRVRLHDDRHLSARVRRARELVARAPSRTAAGNSGPAS